MSEEQTETEARREIVKYSKRARERENVRRGGIVKSEQVYYRSKDVNVFHSSVPLHQVNVGLIGAGVPACKLYRVIVKC